MKRVLNEVRIFMDDNGQLFAMTQNGEKFVVHPLVSRALIHSDDQAIPKDTGIFVDQDRS